MSGFTKLFSCITTSSIWGEDDKTRLVWITMLALAGADGVVRASIGGLAHSARVSREDCERAIATLEGPDPDSRSLEHEGRRVARVDGGFLLLNFGKYREARSDSERTAYMREYMKNYRASSKQPVNNRKQNVNNGKPCKHDVNHGKPRLAQAEAEAEAEAEADQTPNTKKTRNVLSGKPDAAAVEILDYLNVKAGRQFRHTPANLKLITARLQSVNDPAGIKAMIDRMVKLWKGDPRMDQYLQPATLFGPQKFDGYYDLRDVPVLPEHNQPRRPGSYADSLHPENLNQTPALF